MSDGSFDAVCCAHGLHFAPDLLTTLREFARVLRPDGRIAASFPAMERKADHPIRVLDELVVGRLGPASEMADTRQTREILDDPDRLRAIAVRAGLTDVEITRIEQSIEWPDADVLVSQAMMCWWASASRLEQLDPAERQSLLERAAATIRRHYGPGSLSIPEVNHVLRARTVPR
jgi:SAM-dependent methyltransferase